jgi:hypothetical protein
VTQPSHIFIVGSYRTGTSILRQTLNRSKDVAICGETHFFCSPRTITSFMNYLSNRVEDVVTETRLTKNLPAGSWQDLSRVGDISTDAGARRVVDYVYRDRPGVWSWVADHVDRTEFLGRLLASDRTDRALFDLLLALYAGDKPIRGEKTPDHAHAVPMLMAWFPQAKVIHTFRDLRAIFVSERNKKLVQPGVPWRYRLIRRSALTFEMYISSNIIANWLRLAQLHQQYQKRYPQNYYLCRFEDLVNQPRVELQKVCDFVEIDFTEAMLQQSFQNSSFAPRNQAQGFDNSAAERWRRHLHPLTNRWLLWWSRKRLQEFGYQL